LQAIRQKHYISKKQVHSCQSMHIIRVSADTPLVMRRISCANIGKLIYSNTKIYFFFLIVLGHPRTDVYQPFCTFAED
jgi:spore coat polysaccharide biosynthesis protein SpsF (cytidylyltransferase family)